MSTRPFIPVHSLRARDAFRDDRQRQAETEDAVRGEFLRALDGAEFEVTEFEASFLKSFMDGPWVWTPGRRATCDKMRSEYQGRVQGPKSKVQSLPQAAPGTCGYLVRGEDRRQAPCGQSAIVKLPRGLELCEEHELQRQDGIARLRALKERSLRS